MRGHRAGDGPGGGKGKRQQDHGAVERDVRLDGGGNRSLRARDRRQHQPVDRQADQDVRRRPRKAGVAPADGLQPPRGQRPSDGGGEAREQGNAGDRAPCRVAIDAAERAEGGIVKARAHADAEQEPGGEQNRYRVGEAEQGEPRGQHEVGKRQHGTAADQIDLPADARPEHGRDDKRCREGGKDPVRGNAEIARDRIGEDRGQVIARSPGQRLRRAERDNDGKLAAVHCVSLLDQ